MSIDSHKWLGLPCYSDISKQVWRQLSRLGNWKAGQRELIVDTMTPMQLNRFLDSSKIVSVKLCSPNDLYDPTDLGYCEKVDVFSYIDSSDIIYKTSLQGVDSIMFLGNILFSGSYTLPNGDWFWEITDGASTPNVWYSELFKTNGYAPGALHTGVNPIENEDIPNSTNYEINLS